MLKSFILSLLLALSQIFFASAQAPTQTANTYVRPYSEDFQYGSNTGYYPNGWNDDLLAGIARDAGVHSIRPTLPESFLDTWGYNIRTSTFNTYVNTLGMKELTCFIESPSNAHRDWTTYPTGTSPSRLFAHMYEPIWNSDGTVNTNNYYAYYLYQLLNIYGDKVRFWEIVNEPDFTYGASQDTWLTQAPQPGDLGNLQAPIFHYIRMLHISYEVIKKYRPDSYVTVGGVGYPQFVDALLRYTENPNGGAVTAQYPNKGGAYIDALSFHSYPSYSLHYWDTSINAFHYTRTSDYAVDRMLADRQAMVDVLNRYGYNGTTYPAKHLIMSETAIARRTSEDRTGTDEMQRNYGIKSLVLAQKNNIKQLYYFNLGEAVNAPASNASVSGADEINLMGLYENLNRDAPGAQQKTQLGKAFATTSKLLYGATYDAARTAGMAIPSTMQGAAFNKNGSYTYVLWAKALVDNSETAIATYSFPAAWNMTTVQRYEWDNSATTAIATQAAQNITVTSAPIFITPTSTTLASTTGSCAGTGSLTREQWNNAPGTTIADIPLAAAPSSTAAITQFETTSSAYNYGARVRGYVCPPTSGAYTFWIVGDDAAELYLSTSDDPARKLRIASCSGWTASAHDWTRSAGQQSVAVQLVAGTRYYIEALHKQGWGSGYLAVAWQLPNGTRQEPIPGSNLIPYVVTPVSTTCTATGSLTREQWDSASGTTIADIPLAVAPTSTADITQFETTSISSNYGARIRGYVCPPMTGAYTFWIAGDDAAELYLSTDADPTRKVRIASCAGWTAGPHDWTRFASQQSVSIQLVANTRYYIEALHKQSWGVGYLAVAWQLPNGSRQEPIPGANLAPFVATSTTTTPTVSAPVVTTPAPSTTTPTTPTTTTPLKSSKARIIVTFAAAPATATSRIAPTLYNKSRVLQYEEDDDAASIYTNVYPYLRGGIARNGITYPGMRYTDGCGHSRPYVAAIAVNGHNSYNNSVWLDSGPNHIAGGLLWSQVQELLDNGWDVENHSDLHSAPNPSRQITSLDTLIGLRLKGYKPTVHIVPTNFAGYPTAAFAAGYIAVSSQSQSDNLPMINPWNGNRVAFGSLLATPFVYQRYGADIDRGAGETATSLLNRLKTVSDDLMAPGANASELYVQRVFSHGAEYGMDFNVFSSWMSYTQSIAQDRLWVTTLREFSEYRRVSNQVIKAETLSGNVLTIDLDYANISDNTRFQNLSLLIDSPGTISSIVVSGADSSSYNLATKLVNVYRGQNTTATTTPTTTPTTTASATTGTGCTGTGSLTREQWNNVSGNAIASIPVATTPTSTAAITQFETTSTANSYGARIRGYVCPPTSGAYTFWIAGDDAAELYLSTDADPTRKVRIASCAGWTSGPHDWTRFASQQSASIQLVAGTRYYIEALHKQDWGNGYLAVAWQLPSGVRQEPIPGTNLMPFVTTAQRGVSGSSSSAATVTATVTATQSAVAQRSSLSVYPNPFTSRATADFSAAKSGPISIALYTLEGKLLRQLFTGTAEAGALRTLPIDATGLSTGMYLIRMVTKDEVITQKLGFSGQ
jgi:hypothetical protein